jgi:phage gp46-like protein
MGDIRIIWDPVSGIGDINMLGAALELGHDLATASLISMHTDAQADPGDIVFDTDPRGCWIDTYATLEDPALTPIPGDRMGSKIWQAFARPRTQDTLNWLRDEVVRCHGWMIVDGVASAVEASTFFTSEGGIGAIVTITANGLPNVFNYVWPREF